VNPIATIRYPNVQGVPLRDPRLGELIAVDQSLRGPGVAVFHQGILTASCTLPQKSDPNTPIAQRTYNVAASIVTWLYDKTERPTTLAIEWPQIYRASKSKGDPNDMLAVAGVGAALAGLLSAVCYQNGNGWCLQIRSPLPAEWAGQLPKCTNPKLASESPRARRILSRLSEREREVATLKHDALDAIGIGLFILGRLDPVRVFPGAK